MPVTVASTRLSNSTMVETQRKVFKNPRGQGYYYAVVNFKNTMDPPRYSIALYSSSDGEIWTWNANLVGATVVQKGSFDVTIYEDDANSRLILYLTYEMQNDIFAKAFTIVDAATTASLLWSKTVKTGDTNSIPCIAICDGYLLICYSTETASNDYIYVSGSNTQYPTSTPTFTSQLVKDVTASPVRVQGLPSIAPLTTAPAEYSRLYVDGLGADKTGWSTIGSTPYLDAVADSSYILTKTDAAEHGYFSFENTALTFDQVLFELYALGDGGDSVVVHISHDNWSTETSFTLVPDTSYSWKTQDVSAYLDSQAKVNSAEMYVVYSKSGKANYIYADCARLSIRTLAPQTMTALIAYEYRLVTAAKFGGREVSWDGSSFSFGYEHTGVYSSSVDPANINHAIATYDNVVYCVFWQGDTYLVAYKWKIGEGWTSEGIVAMWSYYFGSCAMGLDLTSSPPKIYAFYQKQSIGVSKVFYKSSDLPYPLSWGQENSVSDDTNIIDYFSASIEDDGGGQILVIYTVQTGNYAVRFVALPLPVSAVKIAYGDGLVLVSVG